MVDGPCRNKQQQDLTPLAVRAAEALKAALDHQTRAEDELPRVGLPDLSAALSQDDSADGDGAGLALHRHHAHRASVSVQTGPDSAKQELARRIAELQVRYCYACSTVCRHDGTDTRTLTFNAGLCGWSIRPS